MKQISTLKRTVWMWGLGWTLAGGFPLSALAAYSVVTNNGAITITRYTGTDAIVTIPGRIHGRRVTRIADRAFRNRLALVRVNIPTSVTRIGRGVFDQCHNLETIAVGSANPAYSSARGVLFNKSKTSLICCPAGKTGTYDVPSSVRRIEPRAFFYCNRLTRIRLHDRISSIGDHAFYLCTRLTRIHLPNSLRQIEEGTFYVCSRLPAVAIPSGVTNIGFMAFANCARLDNVLIPPAVRRIEAFAFTDCSSLKNIIVGRGVRLLETGAFNNCSRLSAVAFQGEPPDLGWRVFYGASRTWIYYLPWIAGWSSTFAGFPARGHDPYEDDNTRADSRSIANGQTHIHSIHQARNIDRFKFTVGGTGARNLRIDTSGTSGDTQLWLYRENGNLVEYDNDSGPGLFARIDLPTLPPGTYYGKLQEYFNNDTLPFFFLRVSWTPM